MARKTNANLVGLSVMSTVIIGLLNTGSAVLAYGFFIRAQPTKSAALTPITEVTVVNQSTAPVPIEISPTTQSTAQAATPSRAATVPAPTTVREPAAAVAIGAPALPTQIINKPDGGVEYKWCSGQNPALEDAVCEAILSIASNPTPSNPHLSPKVLQSLSLLPADSTLTMDEKSWKAHGTIAGEMDVTMHTKDYGDIKLHVTLEKTDIWVVTDGQIT